MGNTPSNQSGQGPSGNTASPTRRGSTSAHGLRSSPAQPSRSQVHNVLPHRQHVGRHQQGQRSDGTQGSTASIHQTSSSPSSNRPVSPRRRKSLELPDLNNKLTFTNANAQGGGLEQTHAETVETQIAAGSGRVRSPLAGPPPSSFAYDEESSLGNTPANSKRTSLTSGTRARSPQASNAGITSSLGEGMNCGASGTSMGAREGMPIPGAKPARRVITAADESDNPYFPPVAKQRPPVTPGLPNYSHSPHTGNDGSGVGLAHVEHAEQAEYDFVGRDRLSVNTNIPPTGARQPSPARPAPAVVTTEHHHMVSPPDVLVSALPHGMIGPAGTDQDNQLAPAIQTPLASLQTPLALDPNQTPLGMPPGAGNEGRALEEEEETASVPTLVTWNEGGRNVYVTGTFADNGWKARLKMNKSTHDFSLLLNLPPGTHRLKFIVDDHWRCSSELQTATDGDGNLVNWLEVEPPKKQIDSHEDWAMAEWAQKVSGAEMEQDDGSLWTNVIPPALVNFISIEERGKDEPPEGMTQGAFDKYHQTLQQLLATVPAPPTVPRHLKDPILNTSPKELEGTIGGTAGDDNSILPVPNHVVLNHLTAAAIRNGTLAVGTTTRYKRKYISTLLFKPVGDH